MPISTTRKSVLATVCNRQDVVPAKRLFAAAISYGKWSGDLCLLTDGIDPMDRDWFTSRGIQVIFCEPVIPSDLWTAAKGTRLPTQVYLLKYYLFTETFREWETVVYLDTDIFIHGPLDMLTRVQVFSAVPDAVVFQSRLFNSGEACSSHRRLAFNAGVFAFSPSEISSDAFQRLVELTNLTLESSLFTDQSVLNLYFEGKWKKLPFEFNSMVNFYQRGCFQGIDRIRHRARIVHFAGTAKPSHPESPHYAQWRHVLNLAEEILEGGRKCDSDTAEYSNRFIVELTYRYLRGVEIFRTVYRFINRLFRTGLRSSLRFALGLLIGRSVKRWRLSPGILSSRTHPHKIHIDVSTVCQLQCPGCPNSTGEIGFHLGRSFLNLADYRRILSGYRRVKTVELSNWGEPFLNPHIIDILRWSWEHGIDVTISNGSNMNHMTEEIADALVRYQVKCITCSIDGVGQQSYERYRKGGDFDKVISAVRTINRAKERCQTINPVLRWQYILFDHNESDIEKAFGIAEELKMDFVVKTPWENLYGTPALASASSEIVEKYTGYKNRDDLYANGDNLDVFCKSLWTNPQVNADGRVLGCPVNYWHDYGNVLESSLRTVLEQPVYEDCQTHAHGLERTDRRYPVHILSDLSDSSNPGVFLNPVNILELRIIEELRHIGQSPRRKIRDAST
jgi:lipopolysaccharide biosynthesis glycosyltransferase/MoaA/NifB/PqqE/SkfB family radical SAM enzyme